VCQLGRGKPPGPVSYLLALARIDEQPRHPFGQRFGVAGWDEHAAALPEDVGEDTDRADDYRQPVGDRFVDDQPPSLVPDRGNHQHRRLLPLLLNAGSVERTDERHRGIELIPKVLQFTRGPAVTYDPDRHPVLGRRPDEEVDALLGDEPSHVEGTLTRLACGQRVG